MLLPLFFSSVFAAPCGAISGPVIKGEAAKEDEEVCVLEAAHVFLQEVAIEQVRQQQQIALFEQLVTLRQEQEALKAQALRVLKSKTRKVPGAKAKVCKDDVCEDEAPKDCTPIDPVCAQGALSSSSAPLVP